MTKKNDNSLLDSNSSLTSAFNDEVADRADDFLTSTERANKEVSCDEYSDNDNSMGSLWKADLIVDAELSVLLSPIAYEYWISDAD